MEPGLINQNYRGNVLRNILEDLPAIVVNVHMPSRPRNEENFAFIAGILVGLCIFELIFVIAKIIFKVRR